jgi:lipopolysaccharide/colanic/teichoic acid biosynthesis glycosyltransferase
VTTAAPTEDRQAALRARMRAEGQPVGPDGPIVAAGGPVAAAIRRVADIVVAGAALLALGPFLLAVAWLVRRDSPGPALYRQVRAGRHGRPFEVVKFRTMVDGAEHIGPGLAIDKGDARITRAGRLLRRTSVDELPQLINVLQGDMALVGPRPTLPHQVATYDPRQRERLLVKPGVTGWAQVNGRASLTWPERIELDRYYVAHRSLRLDLEVLLRTVRVVLRGEGVEREGRAWVDPA